MRLHRVHAPQLQRILPRLVVAAGALTGLALLLPHSLSVSWSAVAAVVAGVPMAWVAGLLLLWAAGLATHTITLCAAMPGLTHRRAATLSLTGSFVANVLPVGGAAGVAANGLVARSWGYTARDVAAYTVVTNLWDVLARLVVAGLAAGYVVRAGLAVPGLATVGVAAAFVLVACCCVLVSERLTRAVASAALKLVPGGRDTTRQTAWLEHVLRTRDLAAASARRRWASLSLGMAGYTALLAVLLLACLHVAGAAVPLAGVAAAFACERLLSLALFTPGGVGPVEIGLTAVLVATGGDPVGVVAGVLLYRLLTFALEIPVGGLWWVGWWWTRRDGSAARLVEVAT